MSNHWKVVIIGDGFGGLTASQHLRSDLVDVTPIDRRNYHLFQPLLYQVANGSLEPGEIAAPSRGVLSRQRNMRVSLGNVVAVDPNSEHVLLENGAIPCPEADANFGGSTRTENLPCAGGLLLILAGDVVFLHAGLQGRPLQAEPGSAAGADSTLNSGRSRRSSGPLLKITDRSTTFRNSRMLPGQS
jgi:NADPH-dependent 2,4-dienoyl-CoA reductase/sulfur reductase-like enzyme